MSDKDGGPAFPFHFDKAASSVENFCGMSLRDYFAIKSVVGCLADFPRWEGFDAQIMAEAAYSFADAMLAAREKKP